MSPAAVHRVADCILDRVRLAITSGSLIIAMNLDARAISNHGCNGTVEQVYSFALHTATTNG